MTRSSSLFATAHCRRPASRPLAVHLPALPRLAALLAILCLTLASADAWAQRRLALVIGNGDYVHESKLANPTNDARLIARTLRGLGFAVEEKFNLPRSEMSRAISRFVRESAGADTAMLYYAGHGMQPVNGGRNYLLPVDANIVDDDALNADAIAADAIVEQLERQANPARLRLVVLDACRNNRQAGRARSGLRGLARMAPSDDYTLIAFSTNDQDVALDGRGAHSPYAEALSRHLARAGELPVRRVFELTATDVRATTAHKQRPRTYGDLDSRVGLDGMPVADLAPDVRPRNTTASLPSVMDAPQVQLRWPEPGYLWIGLQAIDSGTARALFDRLMEEPLIGNSATKGFILDLRQVAGDSPEGAVALATDILPWSSTIVASSGPAQTDERIYQVPQHVRVTGTKASGQAIGLRQKLLSSTAMVVLVDATSGPAAEMLAAALQDHKRASILGGTTSGLDKLGEFSSRTWYRPDGRPLSRTGIDPDLHLEPGRRPAIGVDDLLTDNFIQQALNQLKGRPVKVQSSRSLAMNLHRR